MSLNSLSPQRSQELGVLFLEKLGMSFLHTSAYLDQNRIQIAHTLWNVVTEVQRNQPLQMLEGEEIQDFILVILDCLLCNTHHLSNVFVFKTLSNIPDHFKISF